MSAYAEMELMPESLIWVIERPFPGLVDVFSFYALASREIRLFCTERRLCFLGCPYFGDERRGAFPELSVARPIGLVHAPVL